MGDLDLVNPLIISFLALGMHKGMISHSFLEYTRGLSPGAGLVAALAVCGTCLWLLKRSRAQRVVSLQGKYIVVTGCDSGFGLGTVGELSELGAIVIALVYTSEGSSKARASGAKHTVRCDLLNEKDVAMACVEITKLCDGDLFCVVHNAGIVAAGMIDFQNLANYRRIMEVNFFAIVQINSALLPLLKEGSADGAKKRVVLVSSVDGLVSLPANAPYDASKFALEAYADALRVEQSFWNIQVSVVNPATMKTPLALGFFETERATWKQAASARVARGNIKERWEEEWPEEWLDEHIKVNSVGIESIAQDPKIVISDMIHAVSAVSPQMRYLSGTFAKTLFWFLWVCPESWAFRIKKGTVNPPPRVIPNKMPK